MPDFTLPSTWKWNGSASKDQTSFLLPGHTVKNPRLAIFSRTVPSSTGSQVPSVKVKFVEGVSGSDGIPISTRINAEFTFRWPLEADVSVAKALFAELAAVLSDVNFQSDMVDEQYLPR